MHLPPHPLRPTLQELQARSLESGRTWIVSGHSHFRAQQNHLGQEGIGFGNDSFSGSPPQKFQFSDSWVESQLCILTSPLGSVRCRGQGPQLGDTALNPWGPFPNQSLFAAFPRSCQLSDPRLPLRAGDPELSQLELSLYRKPKQGPERGGTCPGSHRKEVARPEAGPLHHIPDAWNPDPRKQGSLSRAARLRHRRPSCPVSNFRSGGHILLPAASSLASRR